MNNEKYLLMSENSYEINFAGKAENFDYLRGLGRSGGVKHKIWERKSLFWDTPVVFHTTGHPHFFKELP